MKERRMEGGGGVESRRSGGGEVEASAGAPSGITPQKKS